MKILNPRDSHLTNSEVLCHLLEMRSRQTHHHLAHGPVYSLKSGNLETVTKEVKDYLTTLTPSADPRYTKQNMSKFMKEMEKFRLEKVELLMLVNNRPESQAELYLMLEDVEGRLSEGEQDEVLRIVKECFGGKYGEGEDEEDEGEGEEGVDGGEEEEAEGE